MPVTYKERVSAHKDQIFSHYGYKQQQFLDFVLFQGVAELDQEKLPDLLDLKYHAVREAAAELGSVAGTWDLSIHHSTDDGD